MSFLIRFLQAAFVCAAIGIGAYGMLTSRPDPTNLNFTATDGTQVDFSAMRGKVILLDFWATWCEPCREEVPNVVAVYQKYHGTGLEVVGVSLDRDLDTMSQFTSASGMVWPQHFDGRGWGNELAERFRVHSIPAMLLFDRKGRLVTRDGRDNLDGQIGRLLAEPAGNP